MAARIEIDRRSADRLRAALRRAPRAVAEALLDGAAEAGQRAKAEIIDRTPKGATGTLSRSWRVGQPRIHRGYVLLAVTTPVAYAEQVEEGRPPGKFPPLEAIADWAYQALGLDRAEARKAAFPIARAIATRGTRKPPARMVRGAALAIRSDLGRIMAAHVRRALELLERG